MWQMKTEQDRHRRFYWLLLLLVVIIFARYALKVALPQPLLLLVIMMIALLGDRNEIMAMTMCCIPLHESIDFFYSVAVCMGVFVLKYYRDIRFRAAIIPFLFLILWELLHGLMGTFSPVTYLTVIIPLLVLLIFISTDVARLDYGFITRAASLATIANGVMLLGKVLYWADFNIAKAFVGLQRLGLDLEETGKNITEKNGEINPNTLGIICVLMASALMQLRSVDRGKKADLPLACLLLVVGALSASRTFLACLAMMILLLLFAQRGSLTQKFRFLAMIILVMLLAFGVLVLAFPELLEYFAGRFLEKDITTGRLDIFPRYNRFIFSNPEVMLWGIGLQEYGTKLVDVHRIASVVPHNGIQEIVIAWGFPGLVAFGAMLITVIRQSLRYCPRHTLLNYIPLLIILLKIQAGQVITSSYTMLAFSFSYLSLAQNFGRKTNL